MKFTLGRLNQANSMRRFPFSEMQMKRAKRVIIDGESQADVARSAGVCREAIGAVVRRLRFRMTRLDEIEANK